MYFLALAALLQMTEYAPDIVSVHPSLAACQAAAVTATAENRQALDSPEAKAVGAAYVCLKLA